MKIVVLCGGTSTERDVSINTGLNVCEALRKTGHNAVMLDAFFGTGDRDLFAHSRDSYDPVSESERMRLDSARVAEEKVKRKEFFGCNVTALCGQADMVFMALHGENGENGKVQAAFDLEGIRYTGTGCLGSAMAMDKAVSKRIFTACGIPSPKGVKIEKKNIESADKIDIGFPRVVKPCCGGSSVGVAMAADPFSYDEALKEAFRLEDEVLVEEYIKGREFSVAVIENKALPVIEIIPNEGFYDYRHKYITGMSEHVCPAVLTDTQTEAMQKMAEDAFSALKLEVYGRIDILMADDGSIYCLEANTLPGMTATSLMPHEAQVAGIDFEHLCDMLVRLSVKKYR